VAALRRVLIENSVRELGRIGTEFLDCVTPKVGEQAAAFAQGKPLKSAPEWATDILLNCLRNPAERDTEI
jgi:hypothetical protein